MLTIGDAKAKKSDFIAGPYFGLYAFGTCVDELLYEKNRNLPQSTLQPFS